MKRAARTICVVTGTRADYGCLRFVMEGIRNAPGLELQVIATGMHLSPEFGLTYRAIETDGFDHRSEDRNIAKCGYADGCGEVHGLGADRFRRSPAAASAGFIAGARRPIRDIFGRRGRDGGSDSDRACARRRNDGRCVRRGYAPFDNQDVASAFRGGRGIQATRHPVGRGPAARVFGRRPGGG